VHGGRIIAQGTPADIMSNPASLTGKYLTGELVVRIPERRDRNPRRTPPAHRRARQQSQERHRRDSARPVHLRHRRSPAAASRHG